MTSAIILTATHGFSTTIQKYPGTLAFIKTPDRSPRQTLELLLTPLHPATSDVVPREQLATFAPEVIHPDKGTATLQDKGGALLVNWTTSIGTNGVAALAKSRSEPSDYVLEPTVKSWSEFKTYASSLEPDRFVFRRQVNTRRLRTAFHRSRRKDLIRFVNTDIPMLHRVLMARTNDVAPKFYPVMSGVGRVAAACAAMVKVAA
jgi:hypothetical protein